MALIWFDGFESYQPDDYLDVNAVISDKVDGQDSGTASDQFSTIYGRNGGKGMMLASYNQAHSIRLSDDYASLIVGVAIKKVEALGYYSANYPPLRFRYDSLTKLVFYFVGTEIHAYLGDGSTKLGETSGCGMSVGTWRYIEIKVTIDDSVGSVEIKSNGVTVLSLSNIDTLYGSAAAVNRFDMHADYSGDLYIDDLYICDTTGTKNNDFLGDVRIDVVRPNGAGTYSQFTPSAGSNYENVDEEYPDDDTTYNQASNIGDKDTYAMSDLSAISGGTIHAVKSQVTVRKTDASARGAKVLTKSGATENLSSEFSLSDTYTTIVDIMENNPDDSAAWEEADVNAMEVGVEVSS